MRYKNWDVLLFPEPSKIPQQEFKTTCHVVPNLETQHLQENPSLLPTLTCFIPSLEAGDNFRISIHSWENPEISLHTLGLKKPSDKASFEARLFIDGIESGCKRFEKIGPWPTVIETMADEHGQSESLKFPIFHRELLSQSYWSPVDNLGRLKVIISEGFIRENKGNSFERTKNIISFSFQHAPLHLLERSSIAWPNVSMWQQAAQAELQHLRACSPRRTEDLVDRKPSPPHLLSGNATSENTKLLLTPRASRQGRNERNGSPVEPNSAVFKTWHESTVDLFTLDCLPSESLARSFPVPRAELLSSEESSLESIYESLFAAPAVNEVPAHEENRLTEVDIITPNKIMFSDFDDYELALEENFYPTLDSDMFDITKAERTELSEHLTEPELSIPHPDPVSGKRLQSFSLTLPKSQEAVDSEAHSNPG